MLGGRGKGAVGRSHRETDGLACTTTVSTPTCAQGALLLPLATMRTGPSWPHDLAHFETGGLAPIAAAVILELLKSHSKSVKPSKDLKDAYACHHANRFVKRVGLDVVVLPFH